MTATRDGAYLAHISDTLTTIAEQLDEQREVQQNVLTALSALLETNRAQSEMLAEILGAASPVTAQVVFDGRKGAERLDVWL